MNVISDRLNAANDAEDISPTITSKHNNENVTIDLMNDHNQQPLTAREMVRAHTYPILSAISALSLLSTSILLIPQAVKTHRYNQCVDAQIQMREAINAQNTSRPGRLNYLKAIEHCEGR